MSAAGVVGAGVLARFTLFLHPWGTYLCSCHGGELHRTLHSNASATGGDSRIAFSYSAEKNKLEKTSSETVTVAGVAKTCAHVVHLHIFAANRSIDPTFGHNDTSLFRHLRRAMAQLTMGNGGLMLGWLAGWLAGFIRSGGGLLVA